MENIAKLITQNIQKVIFGKPKVIENVITAILAEGHLLIQDVPGVGKTYLARSLALSIDAQFKRIQFTPDLLPSDVTGVNIYRQSKSEFEFIPGPLFANIVLADEINRATPRTQSALLEAMQEHQVTVEGTTYPLPELFFVIATQNPLEQQGVYPLPEAQKDRFIMQIDVGYPSSHIEAEMLESQKTKHPINELKSVVTAMEIQKAAEEVKKIYVDDSMKYYIVNLVDETRHHSDVILGGSPRSGLFLYRASQSLTFIRDEKFVAPDIVKEMFIPVMRHRLILKPEARLSGITADQILSEVLGKVPVPIKKIK